MEGEPVEPETKEPPACSYLCYLLQILVYAVYPLSIAIPIDGLFKDADQSLSGLKSLPSHMRCKNYIIHFKERAGCSKRLYLLNIKACSGNLSCLKSLD